MGVPLDGSDLLHKVGGKPEKSAHEVMRLLLARVFLLTTMFSVAALGVTTVASNGWWSNFFTMMLTSVATLVRAFCRQLCGMIM